ncbi:phospholipase D family protein [Pirellulaceae bacterium SH467]
MKKARRIAILMDSTQWQDLLSRDVRARWLNRRYLVVPIHRKTGVFHPKLNLVVTESGGLVQCGSNNLTRCGCSSNLELVNSIPFEFDDNDSEEMQLASDTFRFFSRAIEDADDEVARIVSGWLADAKKDYPAFIADRDSPPDQRIRLIHTYDGPIWDAIDHSLRTRVPKRLFVVSPFHDSDGRICKRVVKEWPGAKIEMLVQQGYTTLPVQPLRKLPGFRLSEIVNTTGKDASRRVHAKLFAWETSDSSGCVVGSANFTSAAFDGRNVEACLLIQDSSDLVSQLFDSDLTKQPLSFDDFSPGPEASPESQEVEAGTIQLHYAVLLDQQRLRISLSHSFGDELTSLRLAIRAPGENRPRKMLKLSLKESSTETLSIPVHTLTDCNGTILASLTAELASGERVESRPVWIVQEERLTYEAGEGSSNSKSRLEDTGEGLPDYLDEIGNRDGARAVAEYLRHLNIRFDDGAGRSSGKRKFQVRKSDPFADDRPPEWLLNAKHESDQVEDAIYDFVDRHIRKKLRKHADRGNINGMENFLDIFRTLVELLYRWFKRGVVKQGRLIGPIVTMLEVATSGRDTEKEFFCGYLYSVYDSVGGDLSLLQEVCSNINYCGEIVAALLIVQSVRYQPGEVLFGKKIERASQSLEQQAKMVSEAISECSLEIPSIDLVRTALQQYRMFSDSEIGVLVCDLGRS